MSVEMKPVVSSNVEAVGYDSYACELHVRFKGNKATYVYPGVLRSDYNALMAAQSIGSHFIKHVKNVVDKSLVRKIEPEAKRDDAV